MSTKRDSMRLLNRMRTLTTFAVVVGLTGCSTMPMPAGRTGAASKMKTFLAIGEKPLPVVTGEPGSTVVAAAEPPGAGVRRPGLGEGRISGRVYDADDQPVPNARVRLAVTGALGGKVIRATTDRSGAFTLHGVRPGSDYTVIAEWEGSEGLMTGRVTVRGSETGVRISLAPQDSGTESPSRVNRVSDREPVADDSEPGAGTEERPERDPSRKPSGTRLNEEDIPPATEAEALAPDPTDRARDGVSTRRASSIATWRPGGSERKALDGSEPPEANPSTDPRSAKVDSDARETGNTTERVSPQFDEGPNPLPPAIERDQAALPRFDRASARPPGSSDDPPENNGLAKREPINQARRPATPSAFERPSRATKAGVVGRGEDREPGALVVSPAAVAPLIAESDPFETSPEPVAPTPLPARTMAPPPAWAQTDSSLETDVPATIGRTSSDNAESANDRKPLTWAEVASNVSEMPPLEGGSGDTSPSAPGESRPADRSSTTIVSASASRKGSVQPICEYDERHRRILDFRLPDLEGKPVRLREIDADLVLIDFWGTWCQPCMRSIPHLVELQERMKDKRLAVIGIACEQDSPEHSSKRVAAVARKLEINYPVLLSRNDGSCPLQDALHISAFPTMVLVDREGRVVWRDQGATPATLARLDNVLDASSNSRASRRY